MAVTFQSQAKPYICPAGVAAAGPRLLFDSESDGLCETATRFHCLVVADLDSDRTDEFGPDRITEGLAHLSEARYLTGHNILSHDLPLLARLHDWRPPDGCVIVDTLIASRLIFPHRLDLDQKVKAMRGPSLGRLNGKHSLEAWGTRLGHPKTGVDIEVWAEWTQEIQDRCAGDVALNKRLWQFLQPDGQPQEALALEHRVAPICDEITAAGMLADLGQEILPPDQQTPEAFGAFQKAEMEKWSLIIKELRIKGE
jgi:hypothetical protein